MEAGVSGWHCMVPEQLSGALLGLQVVLLKGWTEMLFNPLTSLNCFVRKRLAARIATARDKFLGLCLWSFDHSG